MAFRRILALPVCVVCLREFAVTVDDQSQGQLDYALVEAQGDHETSPAPLTVKQITSLHSMMDRNKNGKVSMNEISDFHDHYLNETAKKGAADFLSEVDEDGDGSLSLPEVMVFAKSQLDDDHSADDLEEVKIVEADKFAAADLDRDGMLNPEEMRGWVLPELVKPVLQAEAHGGFLELDINRDGHLSSTELWEVPVDEQSDHQGEMFSVLDEDGDGLLTLAEYAGFESTGFLFKRGITNYLTDADRDADGHLSVDEICDHRIRANSGVDQLLGPVVAHYEL